METIVYVLVGIVLFICLLLLAVILLQEDKSGGGIGIVGGSSQSFFGASSSSVLVLITSVLLTLFIVLAIVIALISASFTSQSIISREDIALTEREQYEMELKRTMITSAPAQIQIEEFESQIAANVSTEDKEYLLSLYKTDKENKYYVLEKKIKSDDEKKVVQILNKINYSQQAQTTIIKSN